MTINTVSEGRDTPALNRLLTCDWRDVKESDAVLHGIADNVSVTKILGAIPTNGLARR